MTNAVLQLRPKLFVVGLSLAFVQPAIAQLKPIVTSDVKHGISPALRDLQPGPVPNFVEKTLEPILPPATPYEPQVDPAEQRVQGKPLPLTVNLGFDGLGDGVYGFTVTASPPDPVGAAGATQYVQWVNLSYAVFDKDTGNLLAGPIRGNMLWQGFGGGCEAHNSGDPVVVYDKLADRWVLTQLTAGSAPYFQCVAVSTSNDATDTFYLYAFPMPSLPDYGKLGVWPDAYYMGFNAPTSACAFEREAMLQGLDARQVCFVPGQPFMLPSDLDGWTPPPDGSPNFFMRFSGNANLVLNKFHVDFENPSESTFTGPITIPVDPFNRLVTGVPQPDTTNTLDNLSVFLMFRLAYRNFGDHESLVLNHSVQGSPGGGGVRWYEIQDPNGKQVVYQQGSFVPDSNYRWMGSIAMDQSGNIALGYSLSSSDIYPSVAITGRQPGDDLGTMGAEIILVDGTGSQTPPLRRWGDYSTMSVDPVDDCTFWYTAEYHKETGRPWSTWIGSFKFDDCGK
jgi:hypothetical protein